MDKKDEDKKDEPTQEDQDWQRYKDWKKSTQPEHFDDSSDEDDDGGMTSAQAVEYAKQGGYDSTKGKPKPNSSAEAIQRAKQAAGYTDSYSNVGPGYPE
eukprot:11346074-Alexandrium_andersonii.AAC.1